MKHYDYIEWLFYKNKSLPVEKLDEMEEHLYNCDVCMEIFLSLIGDEELDVAGQVVAPDFTSKVMDQISKSKVKVMEPRNAKKSFNYQFMYYVAVASVTIFLTLGGFYTSLVDAVPKINQSIEEVRERPNHIGKLTEEIVNSTSNLLSSIENMSRNKEER